MDAITGQPVKTDLYATLRDWPVDNEWWLGNDGALVSRPIDPTRRLLRVNHLPKRGPALYSDVIDLASSDIESLDAVPLRRGTQVIGRLDDSVLRPIRNGHVVARIIYTKGSPERRPFGDSLVMDNGSLHWADWTPIAPDGTFVFKSVPHDAPLQLVAICDGWVSRSPTQDEVDAIESFAKFDFPQWRVGEYGCMAQPFEQTGDDVLEPVVSMIATATARIHVVRDDGNPLSGATVYLSPNQFWWFGGAGSLGASGRTESSLRRQRSDIREKWRSDWVERKYESVTGKDGVAVIRNLYPSPESFRVMHPRYETPPVSKVSRRERIDLLSGETTDVTAQVQPIGTQVIGADAASDD